MSKQDESDEKKGSVVTLPPFCSTFLDYNPTESPKWREREKDKPPIPIISKMVSEICQFREDFREKKKVISEDTLSTIKYEMMVTFLSKLQEHEDIGVRNKGKTKEIVNKEIQKEKRKSKAKENPGSIKMFKASDGISSVQQTGREVVTVNKVTDGMEEPRLETRTMKRKRIETLNLYRAHRHIEKEIEKADASLIGLLGVKTFINETHKILMQELHNTPGSFSENKRESRFKGSKHDYPFFGKEQLVHCAVQQLIDEHNPMINEIRDMQNPTEQLMYTFKCATNFLFAFLEIHPFGDGNGRLARLLTSYILQQFSPFHTPVYNVWSSSAEEDYTRALVDTRTGFQHDKIEVEDDAKKLALRLLKLKPCDLCSMLIESNWSAWKVFVKKLSKYDR